MTDGTDEETAKRKAEQAVKDVIQRIEKTCDFHGYKLEKGLPDTMHTEYLPGFIAAHILQSDFWDVHKVKVLRMAGYAASFACFFVERHFTFVSAKDEYPLEVGVDEWRMAMGVVRTACLVGEDEKKHGIPCNRRNFPISGAIKGRIAVAFAEIVAMLMTDDPARR